MGTPYRILWAHDSKIKTEYSVEYVVGPHSILSVCERAMRRMPKGSYVINLDTTTGGEVAVISRNFATPNPETDDWEITTQVICKVTRTSKMRVSKPTSRQCSTTKPF